MKEILAKENAQQQQFREDMESAGIEVRTYSGRGMMGRETYGVTCYRNRDGAPTEHQVHKATDVELRQDSMGLGTILYVDA